MIEAAEGVEFLIGCFAFQNHTGGARLRGVAAQLKSPCGGLKSPRLSKEPGLEAGHRGAERLTNPA
jgi:hypothetical protein